MKYSYSYDNEWFSGTYDSVAEAIAEAVANKPPQLGAKLWIGENDEIQLLDYINADMVIEHLTQQEVLSHEEAGDWELDMRRHQEDLTEALRPVVAQWLDEHDLWPNFFNVSKVRKFSLNDTGDWKESA